MPVFAVLYNMSLAGIVGRLIVVLVLGTLGLVTTGTVFSAISAHARMRELLLPLLLLPILAPMLIAAVGSDHRLCLRSSLRWTAPGSHFWPDLIWCFFVATWLLCNFLVQE